MDTTPATGQAQAAQEFEASLAQAQQTAAAGANQTTGDTTQPAQIAPAQEAPPAKVKIGEEEFDSAQLAELVQKGKIAKEWESNRPGYNLDSLYADYTKKSMKLAEYEKQSEESAVQLNPEEQVILEKAVTPLISSALQQDRDKQAIELFKKQHPEYDDPIQWNAFSNFFNSGFKLPNEVTAQLTVMEMAHRQKNFDAEVKKAADFAKVQALSDVQKLEMASVGGGVQKTQPGPHDNLTPEQQRYMKMFGF